MTCFGHFADMVLWDDTETVTRDSADKMRRFIESL